MASQPACIADLRLLALNSLQRAKNLFAQLSQRPISELPPSLAKAAAKADAELTLLCDNLNLVLHRAARL